MLENTKENTSTGSILFFKHSTHLQFWAIAVAGEQTVIQERKWPEAPQQGARHTTTLDTLI